MSPVNPLKVVDLFCGAGGLAAGMQAAGFEVVCGVDDDPGCMSTFGSNFPDASSITADLGSMTPDDLLARIGVGEGELDLLVAGPPCQGFSKNVPRSRRRERSTDNLMLIRFLDFCEALAPRGVLIENVAEMRNGFSRRYSDEIRDRLSSLGYKVSEGVINAASYGVPQMRRRAFVLGHRGGSRPSIPQPTHCKPGGRQAFQGNARSSPSGMRLATFQASDTARERSAPPTSAPRSPSIRKPSEARAER